MLDVCQVVKLIQGLDMCVSENSGTPKSSILIGFSIIFTETILGAHPYFWKHPYARLCFS